MKIQEFGEQGSNIVLIQPVDDHDLAVIESEVEAMEELSENPFHLITVKVDSWNLDLSPWKAPAVFGNEDFGGGADNMLQKILALLVFYI